MDSEWCWCFNTVKLMEGKGWDQWHNSSKVQDGLILEAHAFRQHVCLLGNRTYTSRRTMKFGEVRFLSCYGYFCALAILQFCLGDGNLVIEPHVAAYQAAEDVQQQVPDEYWECSHVEEVVLCEVQLAAIEPHDLAAMLDDVLDAICCPLFRMLLLVPPSCWQLHDILLVAAGDDKDR